jgi:ferrochelatase
MERPAGHPDIPRRKIGVLLVNLGTPDAPTPAAVKRYLAEFLSDRRVVELPPILWQPILRGVVLNTRPKKSAAAYAKVWTERGSPLDYLTEDLKRELEGTFGPVVVVDHAMRYGNPALPARFGALRDAGCERILVVPLYPQYCGATTGTVQDRVFELFGQMRWQPALRTLPPYYDDPAYIAALADSVRAGLAKLDFVPDALVTSFHGMPKRTLERGDPYHCHCQKTARLLGEALGPELPVRVSFQSRFGAAEWLKPYTDATLAALPGEGVKRVAVIAPGFAVDCLETLEEIAMQGEETFHAAGGERFAYIPCLNASEGGTAMMRALVARELAGWVGPA